MEEEPVDNAALLSQLVAIEARLANLHTEAVRVVFVGEVCAVALCLLWGGFLMRFVLLCKNQGRIW